MTSSALSSADVARVGPYWWPFSKAHWRLGVIFVLAWTLLAAIPTTSAYLGSGANGLTVWWAMFRKIGLYYYLWGLVSPLIYQLTIRLPVRGWWLPGSLLMHLAVLALLSFAFGAIAHYEARELWLVGAMAPGYHAMSAFTYVLVVICCLALRFYRLSLLHQRRVQEANLLAARLDSKLNLARADSLRMQMNPHFMFNALNSIGALIETERTDRAYEAVELLGDVLRKALSLSESDEVPLREEIEFARAYLALEELRFGHRIDVVYQIEPVAAQQMVPTFILQPLVENAVKHAVAPSAQPVAITVLASIERSWLVLSVEDRGSAHARGSSSRHDGGVGLSNLTERLQLRYGSAAKGKFRATTDGFLATLTLPITPQRHG